MNNLIKNEIIEKFKKYNFQKYPFVFTDVNYKNLINWNDRSKKPLTSRHTSCVFMCPAHTVGRSSI